MHDHALLRRRGGPAVVADVVAGRRDGSGTATPILVPCFPVRDLLPQWIRQRC